MHTYYHFFFFFSGTVGIINKVFDVQNIKLKSGQTLVKRGIILIDDLKNEVSIISQNKHNSF